MEDSDIGHPESISEVGSHGPQTGNTQPAENYSATRILSNMEEMFTRIFAMSQASTPVSTNTIKLIEFDPDDFEADIEGWCNVTEVIVQEKNLVGVNLLMALTKALKGRAATHLTRMNLKELTWAAVKETLLARFAKPKLMQDHFDDILRFQISVKETASESAMRLWNLIERIPKTDLPEEVITGFVISVLCQKDNLIRRELIAHAINTRAQLFRILNGISLKRRLDVSDLNQDANQIFNPELSVELHTDASAEGYGAILIQRANNLPHVVEYFSRRTTEVESRYHSYELETLAVVRAVEHFRHYLYGRHFVVYTDCNSLKASKSKVDLILRVHRWWAFLQAYDFEIVYREGRGMEHADFFSRNLQSDAGASSSKTPTTKSVQFVELHQGWLSVE